MTVHSPPIAGHITLTTITPAPHQRDLRDTQALHRRVLSVFDGLLPAGARILWAHPAPHLLLVQAPAIPSPVLTTTDWATGQHTTDYTARLDGLRAGDTVHYSLIANPTTATHPGNQADGRPRSRGTRRPIPPGPGRDAWARRKLAPALDITALDSRPLPTVGGQRRGGRVVHARHLYTGTATVTDADALRTLVATGVGPGKAYGCGLLLIRGEGQ